MALRPWVPADMVGVTGLEIVDATKSVTTADGTFVSGSIVTGITAQRPSGGTATSIVSFRDDYRPVIGAVNGKQTIFFDTATRQLDIPTKTNLPNGTGDKFWFECVKVAETRTDDRYTWGYGGSNGSAVSYKLRQGGVPYCDIGSVGYSVGSTAVAATGISIISEYYTATDTTSRARYNGNSAWTSYVRSRNSATSNTAHFGNWPLYGNGSSHHLLRRVWGYGTPTSDDWARLEGWASWDSGDNGASLVAGHPYATAAPTIDDGAGGGTTVTGTASMTGAGTMAAAGVTMARASAAMTGTGAIAASGATIAAGVAALSGAGAFAAMGGSLVSRAVALAGTSTFAASSMAVAGRIVSFAGSSALAVISRRTASATAVMSGTSTFAAKPPAPPVDPAEEATIGMQLVPVDGKRTDWPRLVANAVNALIKEYRVRVTNPFMQLDTAPFQPTEGQTYYDTTLHQVRVWNGTTWVAL